MESISNYCCCLQQVSKEENELMAQMHELLASSYSNETTQESAWECDLLSVDACGCSMEGSFMPSPASHETDQITTLNHTTAQLLPVVNLISQSFTSTTNTTTTNPSTSTNSNSISNTVSPKTKPKPRKRKGDESNTAPSDADIDELTVKMSSLFAEREVMRLVDSDTLSVDLQPLEKSVALDYGGTFTVYFNEQNKVCRTEWVYAQKQQHSVGDSTSSEGDAASVGEAAGLEIDMTGNSGTYTANSASNGGNGGSMNHDVVNASNNCITTASAGGGYITGSTDHDSDITPIKVDL